MLRLVLGTLAGMVAAVLVVSAVETVGHLLFPPPVDVDLSKPDALATIIGKLPLGALLFVMLAWVAGAFGGGAIAAVIARRPWSAWLVGALMLAGGLWSMMVIPHPTWMTVALVPATLLPAWLAGQLYGRRRPLPQAS